MMMKKLNYQHLLYFWTVAREGSVTSAAKSLHLAQPTISGQIHAFERSLGETLFRKAGRHLTLTDSGRVVFRYADEIFALGRELGHALQGQATGRPLRFVVGIADSLPKLIVHQILKPAMSLAEPVHMVCLEGPPEELLANLALHRIDIALLDMPAPPTVNVRVFSHLLGETPISVFGIPSLVTRYRNGFPNSLAGAPFLFPGENSLLRRNLEQWFNTRGIRQNVRSEFADSALLKVFGQAGDGLFVAPSVSEEEVCQQYGVQVLGKLEGMREEFYAISVQRKLTHPAVVAISDIAKRKLFASNR